MTVTIDRMKYVAVGAVRVYAYENVSFPGSLAIEQCQVRAAIYTADIADGRELAETRADVPSGFPFNELLGLRTVADEISYRDHLEPVALAEFVEFGNARHGPVLVHDFADNTARREAG